MYAQKLLKIFADWMFSDAGHVYGQSDQWARFAVIIYDQNDRHFVYHARRWNISSTSSYICQLQQGWFVAQFYCIYYMPMCGFMKRY